MSKGILEFNLPEEQDEFELAQKAGTLQTALQDFYNDSIRKRLKYESDSLSDDQHKLMEQIKEEFFEILQSYRIEL